MLEDREAIASNIKENAEGYYLENCRTLVRNDANIDDLSSARTADHFGRFSPSFSRTVSQESSCSPPSCVLCGVTYC